MDQPLVSICMPTYNGARYVGDAVRSAVAQTADPAKLELVVSDSGSTDGTLDEIRAAAAGCRFPVRILNETTRGMVPNWNAAVRGCRGTYVKFLFQDDLLAPDCVEKMLAVATAHPRVAMVFCRRKLLIESSAQGGDVAQYLQEFENLDSGLWSLRPLQPGTRLLRDPSLLRAPWNKVGEPTAVMARRDALLDGGGFNPRMRQIVDMEMWIRLMAAGDVAFLKEPLASFRVHGAQVSIHNYSLAGGDDDWMELFRTLAKPGLYRLLHPATRLSIREWAPPDVDLGPMTVVERGLLVVRTVVRRLRRRPAETSASGR